MKQKLKNLNLDLAVTIYICVTLIHTFLSRILPIETMIDERINTLLFYGLALGGCILLFLDFLGKQVMFKTKNVFLLIIFMIIMAVSSVVNIQYGVSDNVKTLIWTAIHILLFYSYFVRVDKDTADKRISIVFHCISWAWTVAVIYSLKQYVVIDCYGVEIAPGVWRNQGFRNNRLYGVFNDPNFAAITSAYVILMLIYIFNKTRKTWLKMLCGVAMACQVLYIILSGSRTAAVCIGVVVFLWIFIFLKGKFKNIIPWKRWIIQCCLVLIIAGGIFSSTMVIKKSLSYVPKLYMDYKVAQAVENEEEITLEEELKNYNIQVMTDEGVLNRQDVNKENISNNRLDIWKAYIKGMRGRYILGGSPRNYAEYFKQNDRAGYESIRGYETHNGYLSVFSGTGILGLGTILIFLVLWAKDILILLFRKGKTDIQFLIISSIILIIALYTCFFTELFFVNNLTTVLFWTLLGSLRFWIDKNQTSSVK